MGLAKAHLPGFDYFFRKEIFGKEAIYKVHCIKAVYDFAVQGGAISTINLKDLQGDDVKLPAGAIIRQVLIDVVTPLTSGGLATVKLSANSSGDLLGAVAFNSVVALYPGIPVGTAATMVKLTAERSLSLGVAVAALSAGKLNIFIEILHAE